MAPTVEQLFDLVAPIAIYHGTDVCFKSKALKAVRALSKIPANELMCPLPSNELDELGSWAMDFYSSLFSKVVGNIESSWEWQYDSYGCKEYVVDGDTMFSGDNAYCFAWYESSALIAERIADHYKRTAVSWS